MKEIDISQVPKQFHTIELKNNRVARLYKVMLTRVMDVNPNHDIYVYQYKVPCPVCNAENSAFSYDGKFFGNIQLCCKNCGVYFRPVVSVKE
jgi:hypothetical protein